MIRVPVRLRRTLDESYEIRIGRGLATRLSVDLRKRFAGRPLIIITDSDLLSRYGIPMKANLRRRGMSVELISLPAGEASKSRRVRDQIEDAVIALGAGRDAVLLALGGGVVGDLVGFVAATFNRGIPYVQVPTTLVGMVDSAVGGKTGINHPAGKNLIGAFHQPAAVYIDVDYLKTLPARQFVSGMAEVVKYGVIADHDLFERLDRHAARILNREPEILSRTIEACCDIKARVVMADPHESNRRQILNFGHTIGHALETLTRYRLTHGEAVAIGMVAEARLAGRAGLLSAAAAGRIAALLEHLGLPTGLPAGIEIPAILGVAHRDKKARGGRIGYALPVRIGAMANIAGRYGIPVDDALAVEVLGEMKRATLPPKPRSAGRARTAH